MEDSSKPVSCTIFFGIDDHACVQHLEPGTVPFTPEQEFGEMTLSDYDSDEDADYEPRDSEDSEDELEYNSDCLLYTSPSPRDRG